MAGERIFIVEDERIVAEDLKRMLERLGYEIVGTAATGEKAIAQIDADRPDLVLMDVRIQGPMDGIEVAEHVFTQFDIPVIYLTAYADDITVDRAKGTLALGYILKPFEERGLRSAIELALYRHKMDRMLKNADEWHGGILENLGAAVMATDKQGFITYMNKTAENMTGLALDKVFGKSFREVFMTPAGGVGPVPASLILDWGGRRSSIEVAMSDIRDPDGNVKGTAYVLKDMKPLPGGALSPH